MALTGKKRSLPPKVAAMRARKRQKLEGNDRAGGERPARKTSVKADSLGWKSVSMPDHQDNYEGFYSFEEVEDVDVVKDAKTGQISFAAVPTATLRSGQTGKEADEFKDDDADEGDEWSGFDEDPIASGIARVPESSKQSVPPKRQDIKSEPTRNEGVRRDEAKAKADTNGSFKGLLTDNSNHSVDVSAWSDLNLLPDTLAALSALAFSRPTSIQQAAIPEILAGHDVICKASTGSGKTLAFGIPILEAFLDGRSGPNRSKDDVKSPLALILSPTRELAHQLNKHLTELCSNGIFQPPAIATLTGGLAIQKQQRLLRTADIVIGTPGRLWEVISEGQGLIKALKGIKFLVVDEADRLLSDGHFKEVEEILSALDREGDNNDEYDGSVNLEAISSAEKQPAMEISSRQTLVFSATFDRNLQKNLGARKSKPDSNFMDRKDTLAWLISKLNFGEEPPKFIDVNPVNQLATGLKEGLVECGGSEKDLYLYTLLLLYPNTRTLVFANSIDAVRRLTPFLQTLSLPALALHSGMPQKARLRSVERFKDGSASVLVATDVAARGLDIPHVHLVIHYHLPRAADTYVHRSGRTARAGLSGSSILICAPEEVAGVRKLVAKVHVSSFKSGEAGTGGRQGAYFIRTLDIDRKIASRLKPRAALAKKIADTTIAKEKRSKEDNFMQAAAEELGVDYDSEEFEAEGSKGRRGRGSGRKKKERDSAGLSKAEVGVLKAELKSLLKQRVNAGVSEKYLTSGRVDVEELLRQQEAGGGQEFLGDVQHGLFD